MRFMLTPGPSAASTGMPAALMRRRASSPAGGRGFRTLGGFWMAVSGPRRMAVRYGDSRGVQVRTDFPAGAGRIVRNPGGALGGFGRNFRGPAGHVYAWPGTLRRVGRR